MTTSFWKRGAFAVGGAALLLSATIGFTQAQTATPSTSADKKQQHEAVINLAAAKLGLTSDQLSGALKDARKDLGRTQGGAQIGKLVRHELSVAGTAIGVTDLKALAKELAGSTLTAVAQKHGVQPAVVAAALKADVDAKIQALVTAGTLKADRAAALKTKAEAKIDTFMTHQFKAGKAGA
jgi:hypothetical protein